MPSDLGLHCLFRPACPNVKVIMGTEIHLIPKNEKQVAMVKIRMPVILC